MTYTTNIAQNPGLQLGLSGYAGINNAAIEQSDLGTGGSLFGNPGLLVTTPGAVSGEGVITPASTVQSTTTHSASVYIQGTILPCNVTVYVISNPGGVILGSVPVTVTDAYQRATINGFPATSGNTISLLITTTDTEANQFWITNVQIEPDSTSHAYCDGSQPGCSWQTTVGGISLQQYQNVLFATANIVDGPALVNVLILGEAFTVAVDPDFITDIPALLNTLTAPGPIGAMTDFSVASLTDNDPALTYPNWNNAGLSVPTTGYARSFSWFLPPQDYFVSGGQQLYERGAYMAVGFQLNNVPNNAKVIMTDVQAELASITGGFGAAAPSAYMLPRSVQTIIKPDRMNFITNPSFENGTAGWSAVGSGVLTQDQTTSVGAIIVIDEQQQSSGVSSLKVGVSHASGDGASIQLNNLIAGDTYIVSAYVQVAANVTDINMTCANGTTSISHGNSGTGYDTGTYGSGYFGGNPASSSVLPTGQWFRIYTTFQPTDVTATLVITANTLSATNIWIDAVLAEPGEVLGFYFDGNFGDNYFWEAGGSPGSARSYFYDEFSVKSQAVTNVLAHHTPLGISYSTPVYFIPPTQ